MNIKYNISKISNISTGTKSIKLSMTITLKSGTGVGQIEFKTEKGLRDFF